MYALLSGYAVPVVYTYPSPIVSINRELRSILLQLHEKQHVVPEILQLTSGDKLAGVVEVWSAFNAFHVLPLRPQLLQ
jgi:hypothetical protein